MNVLNVTTIYNYVRLLFQRLVFYLMLGVVRAAHEHLTWLNND